MPEAGGTQNGVTGMIEFYWPMTQGEWLAWCSALVTIGFRPSVLFAPQLSLKILRLQTLPDHPEAVSEARATMAGFYLGIGLCAILFAQPLIYLALGAGWAFTAFGRIISMMSDRGATLFNFVSGDRGRAGCPAAAYGLGLI
jgi:hypothetical protein